jgi:hypothetical protein
MSWLDEDDDFGGLDDPFVPRDPDTGDPDPAGEIDDDDGDDVGEDEDDDPPARTAPGRRSSLLRRLFGR